GLVPSCQPGCEPGPPPDPRSTTEVVALVVEGLDTRWSRLIDGDDLEAHYGLGSMESAELQGADVRLSGTAGSATVAATALRSAYGLPSASFAVEEVARGASTNTGFTFLGDSIGVGITDSSPELPMLLDGVFWNPRYDAVGSRCTADPGCVNEGIVAAQAIPADTSVVVVELGINDASGRFATKIDQMMEILVGKGVDTVIWPTISTRSSYAEAWASGNNLQLFAALDRWPELVVIDWNAFSSGNANGQDGWFYSDRIHLNLTGQVQLARFLRNAVVTHAPAD
ncbi:MAG: hypothetical protein ACRDZ2_15110, partial [Ilumatobacteraceae bacterium]